MPRAATSSDDKRFATFGRFSRSNENNPKAHPNAGAEIETHPKHFFAPLLARLSDPTAQTASFREDTSRLDRWVR
jgi:hypothetical protein